MTTVATTGMRPGAGAQKLQILAALAAEVAAAPGLPTLVAQLGQGLAGIADHDQLALAMRGADGRTWALVRPRGATTDPGWVELLDPESPLETAMSTAREAHVARPSAPPGFNPAASHALSTFPSALCVPLRGADGPPLGALGVFAGRVGAYGGEDAALLKLLGVLVEGTARRLLLVDEATRATEELRRVERLGTELSLLAAQEMRATIRALDAGLDFLQSALLPAEAAGSRDQAEELRAHCQSLAETSTALEDAARLEEGRAELRRVPVALDAFVRERVARKAAIARGRDVTLRGRAEPGAQSFPLDALLVSRAVDVLVSGSLQYTPRKGQVAVVARTSPEGLEIAVGDTGTALPAEDRDRLFTKYGRLVGERPLARPAQAFATYFAKLVVDLHGGRISAEQLPEGGPLFRLFFPR